MQAAALPVIGDTADLPDDSDKSVAGQGRGCDARIYRWAEVG